MNYRIAGKFGRELNLVVLAVYSTTAKLKSAKISYSHIIIHMAIPYRTAKFKSAYYIGFYAQLPNLQKYGKYHGKLQIMTKGGTEKSCCFQK